MNQQHSHARKNLLTGDWVLVSPHRTERPWQGQVEFADSVALPAHDAGCYLCPGNERAGGRKNPPYTGTFTFDNDFAALSTARELTTAEPTLLQSLPVSGQCKVVCYSERHDQRFATMTEAHAARALQTLFNEFRLLDALPDISYVQMFENRGAMMGCSNMHPHAQIWATSIVPNEVEKERLSQQDYFADDGQYLLLDYLQQELQEHERIVYQNDLFVVLVPHWAVWPYEVLVLPREEIATPNELRKTDVVALTNAIQVALRCYDRLFDTSTPYSLGFHPRPSDGGDSSGWIFHVHVYPPLLRSATVRKHMVGFELLAMPQRDLTPEVAAERLRKALQSHQP